LGQERNALCIVRAIARTMHSGADLLFFVGSRGGNVCILREKG